MASDVASTTSELSPSASLSRTGRMSPMLERGGPGFLPKAAARPTSSESARKELKSPIGWVDSPALVGSVLMVSSGCATRSFGGLHRRRGLRLLEQRRHVGPELGERLLLVRGQLCQGGRVADGRPGRCPVCQWRSACWATRPVGGLAGLQLLGAQGQVGAEPVESLVARRVRSLSSSWAASSPWPAAASAAWQAAL